MPEISLKICRICKKTLPISEFHHRKDLKNGLRGECKDCRNSKQRHFSKTENGKQIQKRADQLRNKKFKDKRAARSMLYHALKIGLLQRRPCSICGKLAEAHHPDYSKPLFEFWLCSEHHKQLHKTLETV